MRKEDFRSLVDDTLDNEDYYTAPNDRNALVGEVLDSDKFADELFDKVHIVNHQLVNDIWIVLDTIPADPERVLRAKARLARATVEIYDPMEPVYDEPVVDELDFLMEVEHAEQYEEDANMTWDQAAGVHTHG